MTTQNQATNGRTQPHRLRADFPPGTAVFLIGMRINSFWRVKEWFPAFMAMPKMLIELGKNPELGLLSFTSWIRWREVVLVQYWQDLDHLMSYATARDREHLPAWKAFNQRTRNASHVGIWHEAYEVHPETSHIVYRDMPPTGMGAAASLVDADAMSHQPATRRDEGADDTDLAATA